MRSGREIKLKRSEGSHQRFVVEDAGQVRWLTGSQRRRYFRKIIRVELKKVDWQYETC